MVLLKKRKKIFIIISLILLSSICLLFLKFKLMGKKEIWYAPVDSQYKIIERVDEDGNEIIDDSKYSELILIFYHNKEYILKNKNSTLEKGKYFYRDNSVRFNSYEEYASIWECNISSSREFSNCDKYSKKFYLKK